MESLANGVFANGEFILAVLKMAVDELEQFFGQGYGSKHEKFLWKTEIRIKDDNHTNTVDLVKQVEKTKIWVKKLAKICSGELWLVSSSQANARCI